MLYSLQKKNNIACLGGIIVIAMMTMAMLMLMMMNHKRTKQQYKTHTEKTFNIQKNDSLCQMTEYLEGCSQHSCLMNLQVAPDTLSRFPRTNLVNSTSIV